MNLLRTCRNLIIYTAIAHISFGLVEGSRSRTHSSDQGNKGDPLDPNRHPEEVKITTEGSTSENDTGKYEVYKKYGLDVFTYVFNQNVKCNKITHKDIEVWNNENGTDYPRVDSFLYEQTANEFLLFFGQYHIMYRLKGGPAGDDSSDGSETSSPSAGSWEIAASTLPIPPNYHPKEVKLTTEGSTSDNDKDKYKVYIRENVYTYNFNYGVNCTKITHDGKEVWALQAGDSTDSGPLSFTYNRKDKIFTLKFESWSASYTLNTDDDRWDLLRGPKEVKVVTEDSNGQSVENDDSKYKVHKDDDGRDEIYTYTFNEGAKCTGIGHDGTDVWSHDISIGYTPCPDYFHYNKSETAFVLWMGQEYTSVAKNRSTGNWDLGTSTFPLHPKYHPEVVKVTTELSKTGADHGTDRSITVGSDTGCKENFSDRYKVTRIIPHHFTYTFNKNVLCTSITHDGKEVWKREVNGKTKSKTGDPSTIDSTIDGTVVGTDDENVEESFMDFFIYNEEDMEITLWFGVQSIGCLRGSDGLWNCHKGPTEIDLFTSGSDGQMKIMDTKKYDLSYPSPSTYEYHFVDGANCTKITHNGNDIWKLESGEASSTPSYPRFLSYDTEVKTVTVKIGNTSTIYAMDSGTGLWDVLKGPKEVTVVTDGGDGTSKENDTNAYVTRLMSDNFTYTFHTGAKCTAIKCDGKEVWKHDGAVANGPDSFSYNKRDSTFTLWFGLQSSSYGLNANGEWELSTNGVSSGSGSSFKNIEAGGDEGFHKHFNDGIIERDPQGPSGSDSSPPSTALYNLLKTVTSVSVLFNGTEVWKQGASKEGEGSAPPPFQLSFSYDSNQSSFSLNITGGNSDTTCTSTPLTLTQDSSSPPGQAL